MKEEAKRWKEATLKKSLDKSPERKEKFLTNSQIEIERLYTPSDLEGFDYLNDLGFPGSFPFARGIQPTMYRGRLWTMRQYAGFGTAETTNKRYKFLLDQGQSGLSVAFDLPTQIGYDSDHPLSLGEVGRCGVAIDTLEDMEILFDGIPLDKVSTSMTINSTAAMILSMYIAIAEKRGIALTSLDGTIQNDILKEYVARGTQVFPPKESMRIVADIIEYCQSYLPRWNFISISGYHMREAGSTAVQEVAFTLANAIAYMEALLERGMEVDRFAQRVSFFFAAHNNILEEVAKFRAARRLWARIMRERFGAKDERSCMLRFHTQTAGSTLTAQQPLNNLVRVAFQALAAVLGGTQSLHTNSYDEALALPSEEAVTCALRTQQIIAHEAGVTETVDPLGGSYAVEALTEAIEKEARKYIEKIDSLGGAVKAIEKGFMTSEIARASYEYQKEIEKKERVVVGLNQFVSKEESYPPLLKVDPETERIQKEKLQRVKAKRSTDKVQRSLNDLKVKAKGTENIVPPIIEAIKSYATLGEITDSLREVFGEFRE